MILALRGEKPTQRAQAGGRCFFLKMPCNRSRALIKSRFLKTVFFKKLPRMPTVVQRILVTQNFATLTIGAWLAKLTRFLTLARVVVSAVDRDQQGIIRNPPSLELVHCVFIMRDLVLDLIVAFSQALGIGTWDWFWQFEFFKRATPDRTSRQLVGELLKGSTVLLALNVLIMLVPFWSLYCK